MDVFFDFAFYNFLFMLRIQDINSLQGLLLVALEYQNLEKNVSEEK